MKTVLVSGKGEMVIPAELREQLGIEAGSQLVLSLSTCGFTASILPTPKKSHSIKVAKKTGFPYFAANRPAVTREQVDAALADFP